MDYGILQLPILPQDVFIFASDGILESMNAYEEQFLFERLAEKVQTLDPGATPKQISAALLAATDKFSGRPEVPHDDRTLIVLRVGEGGAQA